MFRSKGASIEILDLPSFNGVTDPALRDLLTNLVIEVFSYVAENERKKSKSVKNKALKLQRKMVVILVKDSIPCQCNRKNKLIYDEIVDGLKKKTISKIAKNAGVTRKTVYRVKEI